MQGVFGGKTAKSPQVNRARPISAQYSATANNNILTRNTSDNLGFTSSKVVSDVSFLRI